ncbi:MAG: SdpI family protein [Alphaproteobacteria bacterium]|nr:SdpI family protein [Alphaproteobacteria bacterium]MBU1526177.1 SdpI family protein [Alphaproteobacteria bacterium]MBU2117404.1 SdpI family protein [Alphaproteobacteria bacterium]MBU2350529.1 SdpI family protein [Alphaproteobacteria bacterium]MBU2380994.1 SdpI family protein [Alphaproteobacteria bacterium]
MSGSRFHPADVGTALGALGMAVAAVWIALAGPTRLLPVHWGWDGTADGFGTRETVALMLGILAFVTAALGLGLGLAARGDADPARARSLRAGQLLIVVATTAIAVLATSASLAGLTTVAAEAPMAGLGLLLLLVGAVVGRVGPNPIAGVRTPWALKSRLAWDRSNRLAGRLFALIGLSALIAAPFAPQPLAFQIVIGAVLLAAVAAVFESWRVWDRDPDRQPF